MAAPAQRAPEPAHDPIAIAALIAELPELEAKFLASMKTAEEANKALDVIQDRLDQAMNVLRSKAPRGSKWNSAPKREINQQDLQQLMQHVQGMQNIAQNATAQRLEQMATMAPPLATMAPPPAIKKGGPWG